MSENRDASVRKNKKKAKKRDEEKEPGEKEKEIKCRTKHFEFPARIQEEVEERQDMRERKNASRGSAQSRDKRVVRTVLNRSEYLYAVSSFAPFLPSLSPRLLLLLLFHRRLDLVLVVAFLTFPPLGPMRYLLDYPVLINSSGFIFIFPSPRPQLPTSRPGQTDPFPTSR